MSDPRRLPCAQSRYTTLETDRQPYLERARRVAKYTIPYLMTEVGTSGFTNLPDPYQSIGARGVNGLAGKLMLTLVPPSRLFYRLVPNAETARELDKLSESDKAARTDVEEALSRVEQDMLFELGRMRARPHLYEALRLLLASGNALVFFDEPGTRVFKLDSYAVRRTYSGDVIELVTKELVPWTEMPEQWRRLTLEQPDASEQPGRTQAENDVELYTRWAKQDDGTWLYYQEAKKIVVPGTVGIHGRKVPLPWLALRWTKIDGEHYGRSYCDDYIGDLRAAEGLSRAINRAAAVGAKIIYLIKPNAYTRPEDLEEAEDGGFVVGFKEDIEMLSHEAKAYDLNVARSVLEQTEKRLEYAFLMATAVQRDAERVTAEEFRYMARQLEAGLGGAYSVMADDLQRPLAQLLLHRVSKIKPDTRGLPKNVETTLVTGVDALGRNAELEDLMQGIGVAQQLLGDQALRHLNPTETLRRIFAAAGVRTDNLLRDPEEVAAETQQAQLQALAEKAAAPIAGNLTKGTNGEG